MKDTVRKIWTWTSYMTIATAIALVAFGMFLEASGAMNVFAGTSCY